MSSTRASSSSDGWRGRRRLPHARRHAVRARAWSYEALDTKLARHAKPAYILQLCFYSEQIARDPGARRRRTSTSCSATGAGVVHAERVRRLLPARPPAARGVRRRPAARPSRSRSRTAASATSSRSATRTGTRSTTSRRVAGISRTQIEKLERPGSRRSRRSARAPRRAACPRGSRRDTFEKLREQAELQLAARETGAGQLRAPRSRSRRRLRAAARPVARRPLLRLRGQPVLGHRGRARVPLGVPRRRRRASRRCGRTTATRSRRRSSGSSTSSTRGCARTRTCTSTTTRSTRSRRCGG